VHLDPQQIMALLVATSFAAGLNVYATVATLGLLGHYQVLPLPHGLEVMQHWTVIVIALVMFVIEFFADKIPYFDLVWNVLHTFVRIPIAALIAWQATASLPPAMQIAATVVGGSIALVAHTGKTAVRAGVTPSPEPVSNFALSTAEDVGAVGLTWLATQHPFAAAALAVIFIVITFVVARWIIRSLSAGYRQLKEKWA
jgi:Domain of unknown function (DUF4126)